MPRSASQSTVFQQSSPRDAHRYRPASEWVISKPAGHQSVAQPRTARRVPGPLRRDVGLVAEGRHHRRLHRRGHDHAGVFADRQQFRDQLADHRRRSRPGSPPGWTAWTASAPPAGRCSRRRRPRRTGSTPAWLPAQRQVALVAGHHDTALARPGDHLAQVLHRQHLAGRVGRRVDPDQAYPRIRAERGERVGPDHRGAGQLDPHLVRGVADRRDRHDVTRADPEQRRQPGHQLLRADRRQHADRAGGTARRGHPRGDGCSQRGRARRQRIARSVGRVGQRGADQRRDRVDRRTDRQVHDAVRVCRGHRLRRLEQIPGEVGQLGRQRHCGQCSFRSGGCAATNDASLSILPTLEAPPGEPKSSKNS